VVAEEDVIREIEAHTERPHGIADATFLYTHKNFTIAYNGDRVIEVNMTSDGAVPIQADREYTLSYSVRWVETDKPFESRFNRYLDNNFFEHQIHWFSLFNSFMMVMFLCGLVALILMRTLKKDYARYMRDEDDVEGGASGSGAGAFGKGGAGDDSGWKQVNADVFRRPSHLVLYTALTGTGYQLTLLAVVVVLAAFAGSLYVDRGAVTKAAILGYALTSAVSGFVSGKAYRSYFLPDPSPNWIQVMLLTASLFPGLIFGVIVALNFIAMAYSTSNVLSFWTITKIVIIWALISLPLSVGGTILGRRFVSPPDKAVRVNPIPRPIPQRPWYASSAVRRRTG
jgi:transmembrane 9 superfamily protein 3